MKRKMFFPLCVNLGLLCYIVFASKVKLSGTSEEIQGPLDGDPNLILTEKLLSQFSRVAKTS